MSVSSTFERLVAEAAAAPIEGWDFSWFDGRATEERPSWGYARLLAKRMAVATSALDIQTGGGEVLATIADPPRVLVATESWPPNVAVAARNLRQLNASVVAAADAPELPFRDESFDLVASRHPVHTWWPEIARILKPGGTFLSQQIGAGQQRELAEAILGPLPEPGPSQRPDTAVASAEAAGLAVVDLRHESLRTVFYDIGAVVYFLRMVVWTVPGFSPSRHRDALARLHDRIVVDGSFVSHAERFLIDARKPSRHRPAPVFRRSAVR